MSRGSDPPEPWTPLSDCAGVPCEKIRNGNLLYVHQGVDQSQSQLAAFQSIFGPYSSPLSCWVKSHGRPFMSRYPNQFGYNGLRKDIVMDADLSGQTNGVLQFQSFVQGRLYFLRFKYQVTDGARNFLTTGPSNTPIDRFGALDHFYVKFVNAASGSSGFSMGVQPNVFVATTPNPASQQTIADIQNIPPTPYTLPNPTGNLGPMQEAYFCVRANANYNALWFHPQQTGSAHSSRIRIKDIEMYEAAAGEANALSIPCNGISQLGFGCPNIPGATYSWSPGGGLNNPNVLRPTLNTAALTGQGPHTFSLTVNWNGCSLTDTVNVQVTGIPILGIPQWNNVEVCPGDFPVILDTQPVSTGVPMAFQWYAYNGSAGGFQPISGATGPQLEVNGPGWYCVEARTRQGCSTQACFIVQHTPPLTLDPDFGMITWAPAGNPNYIVYVSPINTQWNNVGHGYYISEVDANGNFIQPVGISWGINGGQWLSIPSLALFERGRYYEIKHGIWNSCEWIEKRRYVFID